MRSCLLLAAGSDMARTRLVTAALALLLCGTVGLAQAQGQLFAGIWDIYLEPYALTGEQATIRVSTQYGEVVDTFTCPEGMVTLKGFAGLGCPSRAAIQATKWEDDTDGCFAEFVCKGSTKPGIFEGYVNDVPGEPSTKLSVNVEPPKWGFRCSTTDDEYGNPYTNRALHIRAVADVPYNTTSCNTTKATLVGFEGLGCTSEASIALVESKYGFPYRPTCVALFDCTGTPTPGTFTGAVAAPGSFSSGNWSVDVAEWVPPPPPPPPWVPPDPSASGVTLNWVPVAPGTGTPVNMSIQVELDWHWQTQVGFDGPHPACPGGSASLTGFQGLGCPPAADLIWNWGLISYGWPTDCTAAVQCKGSSTPGDFTGTVTVANISRTLTISIAPPPVFKALPMAVPSNVSQPAEQSTTKQGTVLLHQLALLQVAVLQVASVSGQRCTHVAC
jgi:hypothetical protein